MQPLFMKTAFVIYIDGIIVNQQTLAVPISSSYNTNPLILGADSYQGNLDNFSLKELCAIKSRNSKI